jgi:hypothetical protein
MSVPEMRSVVVSAVVVGSARRVVSVGEERLAKFGR